MFLERINPLYIISSIVFSAAFALRSYLSVQAEWDYSDTESQSVSDSILASNFGVLVHLNAAFVIVYLIGRQIVHLFIGELRQREQESFQEKLASYAALNLLFIFYVLEPTGGEQAVLLLCWFSFIGFLKFFAIIGKERCQFLMSSFQQNDNIRKRLIALFALVLIADYALIAFSTVVFWSAGMSPLLLIQYECWILMFETVSILIRYGFYAENANGGANSLPSDTSDLVFRVEFVIDCLTLISRIFHYSHIFVTNGYNITILEIYMFSSAGRCIQDLRQKIVTFTEYTRVTRQINDTFPSATQEDLDRFGNECAICLETLRVDGSTKKLPGCNHVFHRGCLMRWIQSNQSGTYPCPVCRANINVQNVANAGNVGGPRQANRQTRDDFWTGVEFRDASAGGDDTIPFAEAGARNDATLDAMLRQRLQQS